MSMKKFKPKDSTSSLAESVFASRPSSSEVIKDAKRWYEQKVIQTRRPITPRDAPRSLHDGVDKPGSRPPSRFIVGRQVFDPSDDSSRPSSSNTLPKSKLAPLPHKPLLPIDGEPLILSKTKRKKKSSPSVSTVAAYDAGSQSRSDHDMPQPRVAHDIGSGGSKGEETADEALYWNQKVLPLVEQLEGFNSDQAAARDLEKMCKTCITLHSTLLEGLCFQRMSSRRRTSLLSSLFRLLNFSSRELHILAAKIILEMRIRNKNLINVCRILFAMCRDGNHDDLFVKHHLLVSMLGVLQDTSDPLSKYEKYEALIYLSGSIKCLSNNNTVALALYDLNCVWILTNFMLNTMESLRVLADTKRARKHAESLLLQIISAFCNMINVDHKVKQSVQSLKALMTVFKSFVSDCEIVAVISRIFSKLTMYNHSSLSFVSINDWQDVFLEALHKHMHLPEVSVHLALLLGDLTSHNDQARKQLFSCKLRVDNSDGLVIFSCIDIMLLLLDRYREMYGVEENDGSVSVHQANDVLIKVIRVIAHLSIGENIGPLIACDDNCVEHLLDLLESHKVEDCEELIVNVLATLNNLSYYDEVNPKNLSNAVLSNRIKIAIILSELMLVDNMACVAEVVCVFGNLTKHKDVRDLLHKHKVDLMMVALIDSGDRAVVYNSCGVLVNMSADHEKCSAIINENCPAKLIDVIRDFAPSEWRIGGIACQLLWNLSSSSAFVLDKSSIELLEEFLNYNEASAQMQQLANGDQKTWDYLVMTWKSEFCDFASPLLRKLKSNDSNLIPL